MKNKIKKIMGMVLIILIMGLIASIVSAITIQDFLVGYWKFDKDKVNTEGTIAYDSSGNKNDGTYKGNAKASSTGCLEGFGNCGQFDGKGDYINGGNAKSLAVTKKVTVSAWVKPKEVAKQDRFVVSKRNSYFLDAMRSFSDKPHFYVYNSVGKYGVVESSTKLPTNQWNHLVGTYDGATIKIYINGIQTGSAVFKTGIGTSSDSLDIGINPWRTATTSFNGAIDEVMVFNTSLSAQQVLEIYKNKPTKFKVVTIQDFLVDMKANPNNYYIWHNREGPMKARIQTFAKQFGVQVSNTFIPGKNFIVISVGDGNFGEYVFGLGTSYAKLNDGELVGLKGVNYIGIYLTIEDGYDKYLSSLDPTIVLKRLDIDHSGDINYYEVLYDYLNLILNYLSNYRTTPIKKKFIEAASGQIIKERTLPTCEEFSNYDNSIWDKDEYLDQGFLWEDGCINNDVLIELTCMSDGNVNYEFWKCPRGCSDGRCIEAVSSLTYQYDQHDVSDNEFSSALDAWLDAPI